MYARTLRVFGIVLGIAVAGLLVFLAVRSPSASIHERVEAALEPFGKEPPPEKLPEMRQAAEQAFRDALTDNGIDPAGYKLIVHIDELVGPMSFITKPDGTSLPLPAFSGEVERGR